MKKKLTHFSLFSGIGGIDLAAEWAGFETVGQVEFADYPTKVLEKNFPNVERWRDVKDVTIESIKGRGIQNTTLLSAGFPCQPHSLAGKRRGSDDERDLWGEVARLVDETKPRWYLGENVPGLLTSENGRFFGRILNDLAEVGYNVGWCSFPASSVGAIHQRERVFIIAHSSSIGCMDKQVKEHAAERRKQAFGEFTPSFNDVVNPYSKSKLQENKEVKPIGGKRNSRENNSRQYGRETPRTYWQISEPPILGVDDGIPNRVDRSIALGNAVVPQQVYPILKAIAEIEKRS